MIFSDELIEKFSHIATPFYYYDLGLLEKNLVTLKQYNASYGYKIHFALKANADMRILELIQHYGLGADCVSGNEVKCALEKGFSPDDIVFAGVGKTDQEIEFALRSNIHCLNCESLQELKVVHQIAANLDKRAPIALRINPNLEAHTHQYITTGLEENKFGINLIYLNDALDIIEKHPCLNLIGIHFHIGSQITDLNVYRQLCLKVNEVQKLLKDKGINIYHLNLGGGLGVNYQEPDTQLVPDYKSYFEVFKNHLDISDNKIIHLELGRSIVAQCGTLFTKVLYLKKGLQTQFVVVDAGMTELLRPALYQAYHKIENLSSKAPLQKYDVVGPVCESADYLGKSVYLSETKRGDVIAIRTVGAYAQVMASRYNMREPARVVYSDTI
jgi:diaminopimelate decarboxylase